jgi:hypothetical protein
MSSKFYLVLKLQRKTLFRKFGAKLVIFNGFRLISKKINAFQEQNSKEKATQTKHLKTYGSNTNAKHFPLSACIYNLKNSRNISAI